MAKAKTIIIIEQTSTYAVLSFFSVSLLQKFFLGRWRSTAACDLTIEDAAT